MCFYKMNYSLSLLKYFLKLYFFFFFLELNPTLLKNSIRISETNKNNLIGIRITKTQARPLTFLLLYASLTLHKALMGWNLKKVQFREVILLLLGKKNSMKMFLEQSTGGTISSHISLLCTSINSVEFSHSFWNFVIQNWLK